MALGFLKVTMNDKYFGIKFINWPFYLESYPISPFFNKLRFILLIMFISLCWINLAFVLRLSPGSPSLSQESRTKSWLWSRFPRSYTRSSFTLHQHRWKFQQTIGYIDTETWALCCLLPSNTWSPTSHFAFGPFPARLRFGQLRPVLSRSGLEQRLLSLSLGPEAGRSLSLIYPI